MGRLDATFARGANDCLRSQKVVERIALKFNGQIKIAWNAVK